MEKKSILAVFVISIVLVSGISFAIQSHPFAELDTNGVLELVGSVLRVNGGVRTESLCLGSDCRSSWPEAFVAPTNSCTQIWSGSLVEGSSHQLMASVIVPEKCKESGGCEIRSYMKVYNADRSAFQHGSFMTADLYQDNQNYFGTTSFRDTDAGSGYNSRRGFNGDADSQPILTHSWSSGHAGNRVRLQVMDDWTGESSANHISVTGEAGWDREFDVWLYAC